MARTVSQFIFLASHIMVDIFLVLQLCQILFSELHVKYCVLTVLSSINVGLQ